MKPLKTNVSITLDVTILEKLRHLAEEDDRSLSQYINLIAREHIEKIEKDTKNK